MRHDVLLGLLMCIVLAFSCQTAPDPTLIQQRITAIKSWRLVSSTRYEPNGAPVTSQPSQRRFQPADWYAWLLNSTSHILENKYGIVLTEDTSARSGELCFVVTESFDGNINKIELAIHDAGKEPITRLAIYGRGELPSHPWPTRTDSKDEDFADYIAGKTAAVLRGTSTLTQ